MKPTLLRTLLTSTLLVGMATSTVACEVNLGDKSSETEADDDDKSEKRKKRSRKKKKEKDGDDTKPTKVASNADDIDVDAILAGSEEASGVLNTIELKGLDTSKAPRLGRRTDNNSTSQRGAKWIGLPGRLEIPRPSGWSKDQKKGFGILGSPDKKAWVLFTTYNTKKEVITKMETIGKIAKITNVKWKKPKKVQLGRDGIPALVRGGAATSSNGEKGEIVFALIETGNPQKVLAIVLTEQDIPKATRDQAIGIVVSTRKRR